jgi:two-component system, chemotaxis family, sensor kinase CheA
VFDTQEIVVKPVGRLAKHLQVYAGCTITGDGRVIMILDTNGIATIARVTSHDRDSTTDNAGDEESAVINDPMENVILFDAGYPALQAVPLSLVARLEEFPQSVIEEADGNFLVQYRGELIPIIPANPALEMRARDPRPVIVFSDTNQVIGVAVDEIRDIVEDRIQLQHRAERAGVRGVCVIAGRATEVIDTSYFLQKARGESTPVTSEPARDYAFTEYLAKLDRETAIKAVRSLIDGLQEAA